MLSAEGTRHNDTTRGRHTIVTLPKENVPPSTLGSPFYMAINLKLHFLECCVKGWGLCGVRCESQTIQFMQFLQKTLAEILGNDKIY